jgi:uncharacterized protein (TIRG00374 family)
LQPRWRSRLSLLLTIVCLGLVYATVDVRQSLVMLSSIDMRLFASLVVVAVLSRTLRALKWNLLLRTQGVCISFWRAQKLNWIGAFFAYWTPAGLGSDAYRFGALGREGQRSAVASTLVIERYVGIASVCVVWLLSLPLALGLVWRVSGQQAILLAAVVVVCLLSLPLVLGMGWPELAMRIVPLRLTRIRGGLRGLGTRLASFRQRPGVLTVFFALSLVEVLSYILINFLAARALRLDASFLFFLSAMPPVYLLLRLPVSIQGWGVQEGAFGYVLALAGCNPAAGVAVSLLQRVVELVCFVVPGALLASNSLTRQTTVAKRQDLSPRGQTAKSA